MSKDAKIEICDCDPEPHVKHLLELFDEPAGYLEVRRDDVLTAIVIAPLRLAAFGPLWDAVLGRKQRIPWRFTLIGGVFSGAIALLVLRLMVMYGR